MRKSRALLTTLTLAALTFGCGEAPPKTPPPAEPNVDLGAAGSPLDSPPSTTPGPTTPAPTTPAPTKTEAKPPAAPKPADKPK